MYELYHTIVSNKWYFGITLVALLFIGLRVIDLVFKKYRNENSILSGFVEGCMKATLIISIGLKLCSLFSFLSGFASQILMSSSLLVVVLGFVFQEGLANIVHGFILFIFKPFRIGDRVRINVDGESITGYIQSMDLRSTIIQNVVNSSHVIVPNSKMDLCVIDNSYFDHAQASSNFMDISITYESNLDKAMMIMAEEIMAHPHVRAVREAQNITDPVKVLVRELGDNGVALRASVLTATVEKNFMACSDIRHNLVLRIEKEPDVSFAYPHMHVISE